MLETEAYYKGRWGEIILIGLFLVDRWSLVVTADYSGARGAKAPLMHQLEANIVIADLDISKFGVRMWCDAKVKAIFFKWRKTNRLQTGIDRRNYLQYKRLEATTGIPVVLGMIDLATGDVMCNTLAGLGEPRYSDPASGYDIVNWDRDLFRRIWKLDPKRLRRLIYDGELVRRPPDDIPPHSKLQAMVEYLRPEQGELPLLHFDVLAQFERLQAKRWPP
jgi:hypothetical protein